MTGLAIWTVSIIVTAAIASRKNFSVPGYIFLALFLGPLALLIVWLVPASQGGAASDRKLSAEDLKNELNYVKHSLASLQEKIRKIEDVLPQLQSQDAPADAALQNSQVLSPEALKASSAKRQEAFEFVFGQYWLNRIGAVLFVLGVSFFISYAFQYFSAVLKILSGLLLSGAFLCYGSFLEKRKKYQKVSWGILGGGWGIAFLTTYAAYYIEETQIIHSPILAVWLLALVSAVAIFCNLKYKSWVVTALTYGLAFITAGLGGIDYSTVVYFTLLAVSIVYLSYYFNWHNFLIFEIAAYYMTFIFWFNPRLLTSFLIAPRLGVPVDQFQIGFCILLISWTLFSLALFLLEGTSRHQARCLVIGNIINACFFAFLGLYQIYRVRPHLREGWDERFWFLIALGIMYLVFAFCYKKLKMPRLIVACGAVAISSAAVALMIHFPRLSLSYFWLLEMTICFALGLYYRESLYRWMGWFLSALIFLRLLIVDLASVKEYPFLIWDISQRFLSLGAGAIVFYGLSVLFSKEKIRGRLSAVEVLAGDALTFVGTVLLTFLVSKEALAKWLTLSWTAQGGILLALGFLFKLKTWRWCSLAVLTLAFVRAIFFDISGMNSLNKIIAFISLGGVLLIVSLVYARVFSKSK